METAKRKKTPVKTRPKNDDTSIRKQFNFQQIEITQNSMKTSLTKKPVTNSPAAARETTAKKPVGQLSPRKANGSGYALSHIQTPSFFKGNTATIQRVPAKNASDKWVDADINATQYDTLLQLAKAHLATYKTYDEAHLLPVLSVFRQSLTVAELQSLIDPGFSSTVVNAKTKLNIRVVKFPGTQDSDVKTAITDAGEILAKYNIAITIQSTVVVDPAELKAGIPGLSPQGEYARGTKPETTWDLIGKFMTGNVLPVIWISDLTGYGSFLSKPNAITEEFTKGADSRTMIMMRPGQTGQTLAHEMGHAMGGIIDTNKHGRHVDDWGQLNLMHGDPIIHAIHKNLNPEQVAAFKGSRFVTS
jgi:hypothetical protein